MKFIKRLGILTGLIIIILFLFETYFWVTDYLIKPEEFEIEPVKVAKSDNAFYPYRKAVESLDITQEETKKLSDFCITKKEIRGINKIINKNNKTLKYLDRAAGKEIFQYPPAQDIIKENAKLFSYEDFTDIRILAYLKCAQTIILARENKGTEALHKSLESYKFGSLLQNSPTPFLLQRLLGSATKKISFSSIEEVLNKNKIKNKKLEYYLKKTSDFRSKKEPFKKLLKIQYINLTNFLDNPEKDLEEFNPLLLPSFLRFLKYSPYHYRKNETKKLIVRTIEEKLKKIKKKHYIKKGEKWDIFCTKVISGDLSTFLLKKNGLGENIFCKFSSYYVNYSDIFYTDKVHERARKIIIALKMYENDNNELPTSLSALTPKYIDEIPQDPYSREKLKYCPDKKVIYAQGRNLKGKGCNDIELNNLDRYSLKISF